MADEVLSDAERIKQLDVLFWDYTRRMELLDYKLKLQAEVAALIWFKDEPRFDEARRLLAERDALQELRLAGLTEAKSIHTRNPQAYIDAHKDAADAH